MATTETSKLRTLAGVVGIGSLALFGATACDDGGTDTEEPAENGEVEDPGTEEDTTEEDTMEEEPMEEETMEEEEDDV
ncbi:MULTISPECIES: hypothetical protein [unclassified Nesterenkonia]|uniref:hypothetical protein n=1 Tax=unclassified Nesterenkonia TaxID=2629769 RepID=UPI001F4C7ED0|nr:MULTISPECIES: hypothetical protein [unclassified Nesterenkonia]MCH8560265.1 hypothetical protein [Nesterenkonia sp. DZ6]MCH8563731.1 hypothetical protein [Nesterenkonia sp. YGD6]MCH8571732.1 hypothetical protein [Nesterenkonia sp. AY15]